MAPRFLVLRAHETVRTRVPASVSALAKAMFGITVLTEQLAFVGARPVRKHRPWLPSTEMGDSTWHERRQSFCGSHKEGLCRHARGMIIRSRTLARFVRGRCLADKPKPRFALSGFQLAAASASIRCAAVANLRVLRRMLDLVALCYLFRSRDPRPELAADRCRDQ